ncbi:hypothetical protein KCU83_g586, partial [Aureobasidium melanogenum]
MNYIATLLEDTTEIYLVTAAVRIHVTISSPSSCCMPSHGSSSHIDGLYFQMLTYSRVPRPTSRLGKHPSSFAA